MFILLIPHISLFINLTVFKKKSITAAVHADESFILEVIISSLLIIFSIIGPAGTGKTESVKALGHQLGRFVLVFNCDERFDFQVSLQIAAKRNIQHIIITHFQTP